MAPAAPRAAPRISPDPFNAAVRATRTRKTKNEDFHLRLAIESMVRFYSDPEHYRAVYRVVEKRRFVSLRLMEFFITKYAQKHHVVYPHPTKKDAVVDLQLLYANVLDTHGKEYFDCFRRGQLLRFDMHGKSMTTTIGQLQLFKVAIEHGILQYIRTNRHQIAQEMKVEQAAEKARKVQTETLEVPVSNEMAPKTLQHQASLSVHRKKRHTPDNLHTHHVTLTLKF